MEDPYFFNAGEDTTVSDKFLIGLYEKDGKGKFMQGSHALGIVLGVILIVVNLIIGLIVIAAILRGMH